MSTRLRRIGRTVVALASALVLLGAAGGYITHLNRDFPTYEGD